MDHEAIVVGGGHNGLIAAAYLARAGLDTVVLEARSEVGGCASTVSDLGARFNICSCDHNAIRSTPIVDELDLARHGLRYLEVDPAGLNVHWDGGRPWAVFRDVDRTVDMLEWAYPDEVEGYRRYLAAARPVAELAFEMATIVPTAPAVMRRLLARRGRGVATMLRWGRMSVRDVLRGFFRSEQMLGPVVTTGPAVWGLGPSAPRSGVGAIGYAVKHTVPCGRPVGGSGALPTAVAAAIGAAGGQVKASARVAAIVCEGASVRGVELADGSVLEAPVVVSACDPKDALVRWLRDPPAAAAKLVQKWRDRPARDGYESKIDAVVARVPQLRGVDADVLERFGVPAGVPTTVIATPLAEMDAAHRLKERGTIAPRPLFLVNTPSVLDPSLQPGGDSHVFSLEVLWTPYALDGGWAGSAEPERWLDAFATLAEPGWRNCIRSWRAMTPPRYESEFNLPRGYANSFSGSPLTALLGRDPELTRYRTPVKGLYLTGAATYPGAGVWGASGRNAAHVVLADRT